MDLVLLVICVNYEIGSHIGPMGRFDLRRRVDSLSLLPDSHEGLIQFSQ